MRLLHTSDWHLGRSFHRVGMLEAQAAFLDHLVEVVRAESVDAVVVAGDVYDRALPAVDAVTLLDDALARLVAAGATVVLASGNHDSARRLGFGSRLLQAAGLHVRTDPRRVGDPVLLVDRYGPVAVYPLPYLEPALVADGLVVDGPVVDGLVVDGLVVDGLVVDGPPPGTPSPSPSPSPARVPGHEAVLAAASRAARADLAAQPAGTRSVLAAHAFVVGGTPSDSERDISVGGVQAVPAGVLAGFDYVALGHLHGRQDLAPEVRYSGSPLAYSFSEHAQRKGSWLVELGPRGLDRVDAVDAPVPRPLALLRGRLQDLLADPALAAHEGSWCQVTLTDPARPREAMERVRSRFPHALELRFDPEGLLPGEHAGYTARVRGRADLDVCSGFLAHVRGREASTNEVAVLRAALEAERLADAEQQGAVVLRGPRDRAADRPLTTAGQAVQAGLQQAGLEEAGWEEAG